MGKSQVHNVFHMSRLKPFFGDHEEGQPLEDFEVPKEIRPTSNKTSADSAGKVYVVERIIGHRGKKGDAGHKYLVKWRGYSPFYSSLARSLTRGIAQPHLSVPTASCQRPGEIQPTLNLTVHSNLHSNARSPISKP